MTERQAAIWQTKILAGETSGLVQVTIERGHSVSYLRDLYYLEVYDGHSGRRYQLYTAQDCRSWCDSKY